MRITSLKMLIVLTGICGSPILFAAAARNLEAETAAPAVACAVNAAQAAIKGRHWRDAESIVERAQGLSLTAHDRYILGELQTYVYYQEDKPAEAAAAYARLLNSPYSAAATRAKNTKSIAELYFRAGNYSGAAKYGEKYLHLRPDDSSIAALVADSYLRLHDYARSASTMRTAVQRAEADNEVPRESWLRIAQNAYYAIGDAQDETLILEKLVCYYQRPEDWRSLLTLSAGDSTDEHLEFGYLRLRYDLGLLKEPDRYEALIFESLQADMLAKAKAVLAQAEERGVFSVDRAERLQHAISREALDPDRQLSHALNEAQRDSTGESDAVAGQIYLGEARYPQAIQAFQRSLRKGSLRDTDEIRIDLGIASLRNHQPDLARAVFSQVPPASDWAKLAKLWSIRLDDQSPELKS